MGPVISDQRSYEKPRIKTGYRKLSYTCTEGSDWMHLTRQKQPDGNCPINPRLTFFKMFSPILQRSIGRLYNSRIRLEKWLIKQDTFTIYNTDLILIIWVWTKLCTANTKWGRYTKSSDVPWQKLLLAQTQFVSSRCRRNGSWFKIFELGW